MDSDSSSKFIGSLTKFLQSLCNGYVEFQRGVELVGHIYLSIDTGEKVDYILHERVSKNDENSVTFVSNSFHAHPLEAEKEKLEKTASTQKTNVLDSGDSSGDDVMIRDQSNKGGPISLNSASTRSRGTKREASPGFCQRQVQRPILRHPSAQSQGSSSHHLTSSSRVAIGRLQPGPSATVTSQSTSQQENINVDDVKLEQISNDEVISLASQIGEGVSRPTHSASSALSLTQHPEDETLWIKQEANADEDGGNGGWSKGKDDSNSNSASNLYPVMLHHNPAYSNPVFPGFPGSSTSSAANPYADPLPGTSQDLSSLEPSVFFAAAGMAKVQMDADYRHTFAESIEYVQNADGVLKPSAVRLDIPVSKSAMRMRRYRERVMQNPERRRKYLEKQQQYKKKYTEKFKNL